MSFRRILATSFSALLASCADRALPAPEAAASLHWNISTTGSSAPTCVPGPHWANAPASASDEQLLFSDRVAAKVVDGMDGAPLATDLVVNVTIGGNDRDAQGSLYITDNLSGNITYSSDTTIIPPKPGCLFSVDPSGELGVEARRIWARVTCAHIADWRNRDKQECSITEGFFFFDHCAEE